MNEREFRNYMEKTMKKLLAFILTLAITIAGLGSISQVIVNADDEEPAATEAGTTYSENFTIDQGTKLGGSTELTYVYEDWVQDEEGNWNPVDVRNSADMYTIQVPMYAAEIKIDFDGQKLIAYGYADSNKRNYVNSCSNNASNGYGNNGQDGETTGVIRRDGGVFPEYIWVQSPYDSSWTSTDLYVIKVEQSDRIDGQNRVDTALNAANTYKYDMGVNKFDTIIVASGSSFPDALTGGYLGVVNNAPIILVTSATESKVQSYIADNLAEGGKVYILGGTSAVSGKFENAIKGSYDVTRLGGSNRYDTNIEILKEAGVSDEEILVATGANYADSISASAVGNPILLVGESLTASQKAYLGTLSSSEITAIGGTNSVSDSVLKEVASSLASSTDGEVKTDRVSGDNRYATSVAIAEKYFGNEVTTVFATTGANYPDGLAGGPLAARYDAPIILVSTNANSAAVQYCKSAGVTRAIALGGTASVRENVRTSLISN